MSVLAPPAPVDLDPLASVIADIEGYPEIVPDPGPRPSASRPVDTQELVFVSWSVELDRLWPTLIVASTAASSGVRCRDFITSMFGIGPDDLVDGLGEPAGAATAIEIMTRANASLFI